MFTILRNREDEISRRMDSIIVGLYEDWLWLDERIESITDEIEMISKQERNCQRLMTIPGIGPIISTAMVAARPLIEVGILVPGWVWCHDNIQPAANRSWV